MVISNSTCKMVVQNNSWKDTLMAITSAFRLRTSVLLVNELRFLARKRISIKSNYEY